MKKHLFRDCLGLALLSLAACKAGPELKPTVADEVSGELAITQDLTEFTAHFEGQLKAAVGSALEKASYELVVDGKVIRAGEVPLSGAVQAEGSELPFSLEQSGRYVSSAEEFKAMSGRGGSMLVALRGKLFVRRAGKLEPLDYARSREVRVPRLPKVLIHEVDAARYAADEANATFYLGVDNPNPFPVKLSGLSYVLNIGGKKLGEGTVGSGEKVAASSTGVFEIPVQITRESYGPEVEKLIKTLTLPYQISGELKGDLLAEPYQHQGEIKLHLSK